MVELGMVYYCITRITGCARGFSTPLFVAIVVPVLLFSLTILRTRCSIFRRQRPSSIQAHADE